MEVSINYWAVLVSVVSNMIIGSLWYSPILFLKPWIKLMDVNPHEKDGGSPIKAMAMAAIGAFLMAYVIAHFIDLLNISNLTMAYQFVIWAWLGLIAPVVANEYIFSLKRKPWMLFVLTQAQIIISMLVMVTILTLWN